jgi:CheY-like chemotaxis protein
MKTVLLVDDDNTILLGTGVRLKSMGYTVYTAKDAVSAVSTFRKNQPDVVVLDISLPAGDGFLVADRLQNLVGSRATPIIFPLSGRQLAAAIDQRGVTATAQHAGTALRVTEALLTVSLEHRSDTLCKLKRDSAFFWSTTTPWRFAS